ncbi:hypothetical protein [Nocardia sp. NPDC004260]
MTEPNQELSFLETSAREAVAEGRTLVIDPGYALEALEKLAEARAAIDAMQTAHEAQLTRMAKERARLQRKVEAAQRPPLGYVVLAKRGDSISSAGPVWSTEAKARGMQERISDDSEKHPQFWRGAQFVVGEIREMSE